MKLVSFGLKLFTSIVTVSFILCSCTGESENKISEPLYYPLNKLINQQVRLLDSLNPKVLKSLKINNSSQTKNLQDLDWAEELKTFKQGDINSPVLRETFSIKSVNRANGKKIVIYTTNEGKSKGVAKLSVSYGVENHLEKIYFKVISNNVLYSSIREFSMQFRTHSNTDYLSSFQIRNYQDVVFKDPIESDLMMNVILF